MERLKIFLFILIIAVGLFGGWFYLIDKIFGQGVAIYPQCEVQRIYYCA